jgi:hypothetical protein
MINTSSLIQPLNLSTYIVGVKTYVLKNTGLIRSITFKYSDASEVNVAEYMGATDVRHSPSEDEVELESDFPGGATSIKYGYFGGWYHKRLYALYFMDQNCKVVGKIEPPSKNNLYYKTIYLPGNGKISEVSMLFGMDATTGSSQEFDITAVSSKDSPEVNNNVDADYRDCNDMPYAINGGWSDWSDYGKCSAECGGGTSTRVRECNNPAPDPGGVECAGNASEDINCNDSPCPVDGAWSDWSVWGDCSAECGGGTSTSVRECNSPAPENGGTDCEGNASEDRNCNDSPCAIDGAWSEWSEVGDCSLECGGGLQQYIRKCDKPDPENGGAECEGDDSQYKTCNDSPCPVDGEYSEWGPWSECVDNLKTRTRLCNDPAPQNGGAECEPGSDFDTQPCNTSSEETEPENKYINYIIYAIAILLLLSITYFNLFKSSKKVEPLLYQYPSADQVSTN